MLCTVLKNRWPGCYIPAIAEKTLNQKSEGQEVVRSLLERFLKEIAKFDYIIKSEEFKIFSRGEDNIEKALTGLPK